jgi:hypothetical protein
MQQFSSLLSWRLFTAQHVSGLLPPIIRSSMTAVTVSGFTFVSWWQSCCVRDRTGYLAWPRTQHDYHHDTKVKPETVTAVIELLMMGGRTPETCWAVNKRQDNKLENCCIRLVIYLKRFVPLITTHRHWGIVTLLRYDQRTNFEISLFLKPGNGSSIQKLYLGSNYERTM